MTTEKALLAVCFFSVNLLPNIRRSPAFLQLRS